MKEIASVTLAVIVLVLLLPLLILDWLVVAPIKIATDEITDTLEGWNR